MMKPIYVPRNWNANYTGSEQHWLAVLIERSSSDDSVDPNFSNYRAEFKSIEIATVKKAQLGKLLGDGCAQKTSDNASWGSDLKSAKRRLLHSYRLMSVNERLAQTSVLRR